MHYLGHFATHSRRETNEKNKIVEYQTKNWAEGKAQLANTKKSIFNLFKGKKNDTQN